MAYLLRVTRSALETAHSAFCLHILYTYVVSWAGDTLAVANLVWSVFSVDSFEVGLPKGTSGVLVYVFNFDSRTRVLDGSCSAGHSLSSGA